MNDPAQANDDEADLIRIPLPEPVLRFHASFLKMRHELNHEKLKFTLDGRLIGDIAEHIVVDAFGLNWPEKRTRGVDAFTRDGQSVQIKSRCVRGQGPAFTHRGCSKHLIFVRIDFAEAQAVVLYNGPEQPVSDLLPAEIRSTVSVNLRRVRELDRQVLGTDRLQPISAAASAPALVSGFRRS